MVFVKPEPATPTGLNELPDPMDDPPVDEMYQFIDADPNNIICPLLGGVIVQPKLPV